MHPTLLKYVFLAVVLLFPACRSVAPSTPPPGVANQLAPHVIVPLEHYAGRLKQTMVHIGDRTYPFLFDTGGGLTLISPELAAAIGCQPYGRMTGFRMSGEEVHFQQCGETQIAVNGLALTPAVGVFDLMALLPEGLPPLFGVLSLHTFQDYPITLDLQTGELTVEAPESMLARVLQMEPMRVSIEREIEGRAVAMYVEAEAVQGKLLLLLDSGNLRGVVLAPHAFEQLGISPPPAGDRINVELLFRDIGAFDLEVEASSLRHDGAVGAEFMEGLVLLFDLPTGRLWAQRR
jgi:predicted aspartyl protease